MPLFCSAQSLNLGFLFRPGIVVGGEYTGDAAINDTASFGITKYRMQATIPLKTKLGVNLKKLDLKASQTFLTFNSSLRQPTFSNYSFQNQNIYTFSAGITSLTAGIRNGIWLYSGNVYFSESANTLGLRPNALGYIAKIKLNDLKFVYFYGAAAVYNFGKPLAIPIAGFSTKLTSNVRLTAILPVQLKLSYTLTKKSNIELASTVSGFNAVYRDSSDIVLNYRHLKNNFVFNTKLASHLKLSVEAGVSTLRKITVIKSDGYPSLSPGVAPYVSASINYTFGKSLFGMKLEGVD